MVGNVNYLINNSLLNRFSPHLIIREMWNA